MLINLDLKQIEVCIFAQLCKDKTLIDLLNQGKDIHRFIASNVLNKPENEVTDDELTVTKKSTFGIIYGNGARTLSERTGRDETWCQDFIEEFYRMFPRAKSWHKKIREEVEETGRLKLFTGMSLKFKKYPAKFDWQKRQGITESYNPPDIKNHPVQHLAGVIMSILAGEFYRRQAVHKRMKYILINTVHDSLMIDSKEEFVDEAILDLTGILALMPEIVYNTFNEELLVPIRCDISIGEKWSDL